jgi:hypothetical protein
MPLLNDAQIALAVKAMNEYLSSPPNLQSGDTAVDEAKTLDRERHRLIEGSLLPAINAFLVGLKPLSEFKPEVDRLNKRHELWGFKGIKGQMFFNLVYNAALDEKELTVELGAAIAAPDSIEMAKSRIRNFASYVRRVGDALVESGGSKHARPKLSSIPFFLSYFWQIQDASRWAVYFTNSVQVLGDLNLFQPTEDMAESYVDYLELHVQLQEVFSAASGKTFTLYDVEHVWWYAGQSKQPAGIDGVVIVEPQQVATVSVAALDGGLQLLPDSYVPPIVAIIPMLATNAPELELAAKNSGTSLPRALEKSIHSAFTILGYDSQLLGQGAGRVQDGLAISADDSYAIIWDAKARQGGYKMGTDDRAIREYITTQSRDLKKRRHLRNLYYCIISSGFQDDFDDLIRGLKMDTNINEVCLVEADAVVAMVDAKLREPTQLSLGPDGLQRLFCRSGILTSDMVREELG